MHLFSNTPIYSPLMLLSQAVGGGGGGGGGRCGSRSNQFYTTDLITGERDNLVGRFCLSIL